MIDLDVERLFDDDYPALSISVKFGTLEKLLGTLTEFVPLIQDQTLVRFSAEIERKSSTLTSEDVIDELEHVKSVIENLVPTHFYGAFVISLYSAVESAITEIADYVKKKEISRLALSDLREANTLKRLALYIETVMKQSAKWN